MVISRTIKPARISIVSMVSKIILKNPAVIARAIQIILNSGGIVC